MAKPVCRSRKQSGIVIVQGATNGLTAPAAKTTTAAAALVAAARAVARAAATANAINAGAQGVGLAAVAFATRHAKLGVQFEGGAFVATRLGIAWLAWARSRALGARALLVAALRAAWLFALRVAWRSASTAKTVAALACARWCRFAWRNGVAVGIKGYGLA